MFDNNLHAFQTDLQNGMSIEEALQKHNLTFKEVVSRMHGYQRTKKTVPKKESMYYVGKYLQKRYGNYYIRKKVKGKDVYYGVYKTLEDAIKVRDYFEEHGWLKNNVDKVCEVVGVERVRRWKN